MWESEGLGGECFQPLCPNCVIHSQNPLMERVVVLAGDGATLSCQPNASGKDIRLLVLSLLLLCGLTFLICKMGEAFIQMTDIMLNNMDRWF